LCAARDVLSPPSFAYRSRYLLFDSSYYPPACRYTNSTGWTDWNINHFILMGFYFVSEVWFTYHNTFPTAQPQATVAALLRGSFAVVDFVL
jgi:hypothetical protein